MKVNDLKKILETVDDDFEVLTYDPDECNVYKAEVNVYRNEKIISFDHFYERSTKVKEPTSEVETYYEYFGE